MGGGRVLDIGEVADRTGLAVSALRYYDERGLIESVGRVGLRRQFDESVIDRLGMIALWRHAGFSLDEIRDMLSGVGGVDRDRLRHRADELDAVIDGLKAVRDNLRHAAACPESDHLQCASFRRLMAEALPGPGT